MKKLMISAVALLFGAGTAMAQDMITPGYPATTTTSTDLKASGGDVTLEANVNLFADEPVRLSNSLNQIKVRYFLSDNTALRLGFNVGLNTESTPGDATGDKITERQFTLSVMPGIERHFEGTGRLSPYIGAELGFAIDNRKTTEIYDRDTYITSGEAFGGYGSFTFGLNAVAGFDFYVARHLFVGYELGFGLQIRSESDVVFDGNLANSGSTHFGIGPNVRNGVRVGFVF